MGLKRDLLGMVFGAVLTALFLQVGILSPANNFLENVLGAFVVYIVTKFLAIVFGGR